MANAEVITFKKEVVTVIDEPGFSVSLSQEEATTLVDVLEMISGLPGSRRDHTDSILRALRAVGARGLSVDVYPDDVDLAHSTIHFLPSGE